MFDTAAPSPVFPACRGVDPWEWVHILSRHVDVGVAPAWIADGQVEPPRTEFIYSLRTLRTRAAESGKETCE